MSRRVKLAMQRTWTAASIWTLCSALPRASAANMVFTVVMVSGADGYYMDEDEGEGAGERKAKATDNAPTLEYKGLNPPCHLASRSQLRAGRSLGIQSRTTSARTRQPL